MAAHVERLQAEVDDLALEVEHHRRLATLGTLVVQVAHDSNNLLTPLLSRASAKTDHPAALAKCREAARRVADLNSALLGYARRPEPLRECSVRDCIESVDDRSGGEIRRINAVSPDLCVRMSQDDLSRVFQNLLNNAADAKATRVNITAAVVDDIVAVSIEDDAGGLPKELADRIFEPFVTGRRGGNGLGLAICRDLITAAGGTLTVTNRRGVGSTFHLNLPQAQASAGTGSARKAA